MKVTVPMVPSKYPLLRYWQIKGLAVGPHEYGSRQALVNEWFMHMGVIENPREKRV